jgi:hypothetical protein
MISSPIGFTLGDRQKISRHKNASMFRSYDITDENDLRQAIETVERYHFAGPLSAKLLLRLRANPGRIHPPFRPPSNW